MKHQMQRSTQGNKSGICNSARENDREYGVDHGDFPGGPIEPWCEVEEAGKGDKMFKCFEGEE